MQSQVFVKLIRRYKYLERAFEDEIKKVLMYTKGFQPEHRTKLADVTAIFLAQVRSPFRADRGSCIRI